MSKTIISHFSRRRVKSENTYLPCDPVTYPKPESQKNVQEIFNSFDKYNLFQKVDKEIEFDVPCNNDESDCHSNSVSELLTKNTNRGVVESWTSKEFNISIDGKEYSFCGKHLKSKCGLQLESVPCEYGRKIGYMVTSNSYHRSCYGTQSFITENISKLLYNQKEVLINEEGNDPFYKNKSILISAGALPPHNIELDMDYSPTFHLENTKYGNNLKEINRSENLFIYLTMGVFVNNECWKYFPVYDVQFYSSILYNENLDENLFKSSHKCGIVSHDVHREFPLKVLSYPNQQNGEYIVSRDSKTGQVCVESYPNNLMGLTEEEFRRKCQNSLLN